MPAIFPRTARLGGHRFASSFALKLALSLALLAVVTALAACGGSRPEGEKVAVEDEVPPVQPRPEMPAPPPPAPALNHYADLCLGGELPAEREALRALTADCFDNLLETLRATIGAGELPQAVVGPPLDEAEVAVRHLTIGVSDGDLPARVGTAAVALVDLASAIGEAIPGSPAQEEAGVVAEAEARAAAEAFDPETPFTDQRDALATYLRTADGQVRPLVRFLGRSPDSAAAAGDDAGAAAGGM